MSHTRFPQGFPQGFPHSAFAHGFPFSQFTHRGPIFDDFEHDNDNNIDNDEDVNRGVPDTKFYDDLGVSKDATQEEIKKAHKVARLKHHPDKGGDEERFKAVHRAYQVLSDPEKRAIYDKHGTRGIEQFENSSSDSSHKQQSPLIRIQHEVTLEDMYNGGKKQLEFKRNAQCKSCNGAGNRSGKKTKCGKCGGHGLVMIMRQLGPGMIQQQESACPLCRGRGSVIDDKDKCVECEGQGVISEVKVVDLFIPRGAKEEEIITLKDVGHEIPDCEKGDVHVKLITRKHPVFDRAACHLFIKQTIPFQNILLGFYLNIQTLDNRIVTVSYPRPFRSTESNRIRVPNEGMPKNGDPFNKGDLYIHIQYELPTDSWIHDHRNQIENLFGSPSLRRKAGGSQDSMDTDELTSKHKVDSLTSMDEVVGEEVSLDDVKKLVNDALQDESEERSGQQDHSSQSQVPRECVIQ